MVHELGKAEGLSLVRKRLRENCSEELIFELLRKLKYSALAITSTIAFMVNRQKTVQQFLSYATKAKFLSYEFSEHARPENTLKSLTKILRISFESIRGSNRRAADLLYLINFFQHQGIPAILLRDKDEAEEDFELQEAAALLKASSFLDENNSVFSTHRLVQLAIRRWLEEEVPEDVDRWAFKALKSIASQFPEPSSRAGLEYFKLAEMLLPHAELILQHQFKKATKESELARAKLYMSSGDYLHWKGNYDEALLRFERSMEINGRLLGKKHVDTMDSMALLGWIMALARRECVLGRKHSDMINCMEHLSSVLSYQSKAEEAIKLRRDVYDAKKKLLGDLHPDTLITEANLALMLSESDETLGEAFSLWILSLGNSTEALGPNHSGTLITATNFVQKLVSRQRSGEARELCVQCLAKAGDSLYKDNLYSQSLLEEIKKIWQKLLETNAVEEIPIADNM
ncbi:uncharacterized protein TrAtP1_009449 [Trichoderma atroviride]|uniref:uncharacterized protein n=1 Tax=Hypocrea atroviridis TaxID=63577 RepID=UPI00333326CA|nr:hypothetical protein TrAtP1_009449 [Trichoderma atroviride]